MGNSTCGRPSAADGDIDVTSDYSQNTKREVDLEMPELIIEAEVAEEHRHEESRPGSQKEGECRDAQPKAVEETQEQRTETLIEEAKVEWEAEENKKIKKERYEDWQANLQESRRQMKEDMIATHRPANRYGTEASLPTFEAGRHIPILALLNPLSGAAAGLDIISVCKQNDYYRDRCFNILDVTRGQRSGGLLDVFRIELCKAKDEAKALGTRPRLVSGGGDGTGSFALFIIFLALKADPAREDEGLKDTGNGFIWTDEEMAASFPALAQMPLGSANDFANILGWGQKYPGDTHRLCGATNYASKMLFRWFDAVISPSSRVVNFDIWGILPKSGADHVDFKIAEIVGDRGRCPNEKVEGKRQVKLREAGKPVPLFVCLYFSAGFGAYMTARFQLNRHKTPSGNRVEYVRQALGIIAETTPPQLQLRLNGVEIDCEGQPYFPPRRDRGNRGRGYREVGFYNINWQAHAVHGASRARVDKRLCCSVREPVTFNDGLMDMFRWRFSSLVKNPGLLVQTDKKRDMELKYNASHGQGLFFQWDGEARFAFSPTGQAFHIFIRKVLNIPVVVGPYHCNKLTGNVDNGLPVRFDFFGDNDAEREKVRRRVLAAVNSQLDTEMNATRDEIFSGSFTMRGS